MKQVKRRVRDVDLTKAGAALRRAAARARTVAKQTNTPLVIYENGRLTQKRVARIKAK